MKWLLACVLLILAPVANAADATTRNVQQQLSELGFYYGEIDGEPGPETDAAIRRFQIRNGLSVTGTLTDETMEKLRSRTKPNSPGAAPTKPRPAEPQTPPVNDSDREFLDNEPAPEAEDDQSPGWGEEMGPPGNEQWRGGAPPPDLSGFDALFAGTPLVRARRELQRELLMRVQIELRNFRYYVGEIDGIPGRMTSRAIFEFQQDEGLNPTGRLDAPTLRALGVRPVGFNRARRRYVEPPRAVFRGYWVD
jgi:peptidoglycan hydrolase-like protein with peptidoglycan-binding domain